MLMILKGSMKYYDAITNKHWFSKKHMMSDFLIGNGQKVRKYHVQEYLYANTQRLCQSKQQI